MIKNGLGRYTTVASRSGRRGFIAQADSGFAGSVGGGNYGMASNAVAPNMDIDVLDGLLSYKDETVVRRIYRDIYYHDVIAGGAVDIQSTLPFSSFSLTGIDDSKMLKAYHHSIENLSLKSLMPSLTVDYHVLGAFCGVPNFDAGEKIYKTMMPVNLDLCEMTANPFFNVDPIIDLKFTKDTQKFLTSTDPRAQRVRDMMPPWMKEGIRQGKVLLSQDNVVYIPRRGFTTSSMGTSYFRRILPIFMLEKALLRGTIGQAHRRQRPIGMLTAGDEEWEPTNDELNSIVTMFMQADMDPVGAYVAMRQGVQYQEIRQGQDFWSYDNIFEFAAGAKMRGLGISEILLTGDANYNTMDAAMSVFIEGISNYRDRVTRELFYDRLFPVIAAANDFRKTKKHMYDTTNLEIASEADRAYMGRGEHRRSGIYAYDEHTSDGRVMRRLEAVCDGSLQRTPEIDDLSQYVMPQVHWHKQLKPKGDRDYLDILTALQEKNVPVSLRMYAAAAGLNLDDLLDGTDEDLKIREKLADYYKEVAKFDPAQQGMGGDPSGFGGGGGYDDGSGDSSGGSSSSQGQDDGGDDFGTFAALVDPRVTGSGIRRKSIMSRSIDVEDPRHRALTVKGMNGKGRLADVSPRRRREIDEALNRVIAGIASDHDKRSVHKENRAFQERKTKSVFHKR